MKRLDPRTMMPVLLGLAIGLGLGEPRADDGAAERTRPRYQREAADRPTAAKPRPASLPEALRLEVRVEAGEREVVTGEKRTAHRRVPRGLRSDLRADAARAADWAAREVALRIGRLEYYRAGFHSGLRMALDDERLGAWDFRQGLRLGRRDRDARRIGRVEGTRAAEEEAVAAARKQVERQFLDLRREPRFLPRWQTPGYAPATAWAVAPELAEVFAETPLPAGSAFNRRFAEAFDSWRFDPFRLYGCDSHTVFFDARWDAVDRAFDLWLSDWRRSRAYRQLRTREERERFEQLFRAEFHRRLARRFDAEVQPAYAAGFNDGWRYGARVSFEWNFRLGYTEGFDHAATAAASAAFVEAFGIAFERGYDLAFSEWMESARPDILEAVLLDADDDGIFQPGESFRVECELANYGGAAGAFELRLSGGRLNRGLSTRVRLAGREVTRLELPAEAVIDARTPARTSTSVTLEIAERSLRLPLLVSHPLEFEGRAALAGIDALAGRARVEVRVVNRSRRAVAAVVDLTRIDRDGPGDRAALGRLLPGSAATATFSLSGIDPLDLIAGRTALRLEALGNGALHDAQTIRLPDLAVDLTSDDLLRYMIALSGDSCATHEEILEARMLMLRRMRADWNRAVRASGNPYKRDYRLRRGETALGELVDTWAREQARVTRPEVFAGLGSEIEMLAGELPGVHPFLRKYMRRLARRL